MGQGCFVLAIRRPCAFENNTNTNSCKSVLLTLVEPAGESSNYILDGIQNTRERFTIKSTELSINYYIVHLTHEHPIVKWNIEQARPMSVSTWRITQLAKLGFDRSIGRYSQL